MNIPPTSISFEELYDDASGVEFAVSYNQRRERSEIEFKRIDTVGFPIDRLDWLIDRLILIRDHINDPQP